METIGGYRLLRSLGAGPRAEVWLGHSERGVAAIKLFRPGVATESIDAEIESLGRASSRHLLRLEDLATAPDGRPCLILGRLSATNLGGVLDRDAIAAGEAVTMLAPIALAVSELHRVGVAHGTVRAGSVLFDDSAAPVLACFGDARPVAAFPDPPDGSSLTPAGLAAEPTVARDVAHLAELGSLVLSQAPGTEEVMEWIAATRAEADASTWPAELAERMFRVAEARPLRLGARPGRPGGVTIAAAARAGALPAGAASAEAAPAEAAQGLGAPARWREPSPRAGGWWRALPIPSDLAATMADWLDSSPSRALLARVRDFLRPVRRPVWIAAGLVAVCVVAGIALLPSGSRSDSSATSSGAEATGPSPTPYPGRGDPRVLGEDPIEAAEALLGLRAECFRLQSVLCLDGVDQSGSAAMDADGYAIRLDQQGGVRPPGPDYTDSTITLVERLGDAVLLELSPGPAGSGEQRSTLLLVREDAGWRIRDLVPLTTGGGQSMPSTESKSPRSSRSLTATRNRAASAPSTIR